MVGFSLSRLVGNIVPISSGTRCDGVCHVWHFEQRLKTRVVGLPCILYCLHQCVHRIALVIDYCFLCCYFQGRRISDLFLGDPAVIGSTSASPGAEQVTIAIASEVAVSAGYNTLQT